MVRSGIETRGIARRSCKCWGWGEYNPQNVRFVCIYVSFVHLTPVHEAVIYQKCDKSLGDQTFEYSMSRQRASGTPKEEGHRPNRPKRSSSICEKDT
jgi:hypothetical protein